jgi:hypothetical protein
MYPRRPLLWPVQQPSEMSAAPIVVNMATHSTKKHFACSQASAADPFLEKELVYVQYAYDIMCELRWPSNQQQTCGVQCRIRSLQMRK